MLFQTPEFAVFMTALLVLFAFFRRSQPRKVILLIGSYIFYMWANPAFIALLVFITVLNYVTAKKINNSEGAQKKKILLFNCVISIGLLAFFKYAGFLEQNMMAFMRLFGQEPSWNAMNVALPVGISFYTFHTLSYTIDVYRGKMKASEDWLDFAIFASFFPQLVAGPILRASQFLPDLAKPVQLHFNREIVFLCLRGLVKKMIIADNLGRFVDTVAGDPGAYPSVVIIFMAICYSTQIYCDFSGYSDIAIGLTKMFGIELPLNFNRPFFARNPSDFWNRWHISLSTWLRDYLYIPLGGNRGGEFNTYRNLALTMLLGGLWHGASWNFVLWGALHGFLLVVHRLYTKFTKKEGNPDERGLGFWASWLVMQYFVVVTWITFRIQETGDMLTALKKFIIFDGNLSLSGVGIGNLSVVSTFLFLIFFWFFHWIGFFKRERWEQIFARQPLPIGALACIVIGAILYFLWPLGSAPFIYFQF